MIHVIDDKELNARMEKVVNKILDIWYNEKFTAKDALWCLKCLEWEIETEYYKNKEVKE